MISRGDTRMGNKRRNGPRRHAFAEITHNGETATLGPWTVSVDVAQSWLLELLEDGHADRAPKPEPPPARLPFQNLVYEDPAQGLPQTIQLAIQLRDLLADQVQKDANGNPQDMFVAQESALRTIVIGEFAHVLWHPDDFSMLSAVPHSEPSTEQLRRCKATLRSFIFEKREAGYADLTIFRAFMTVYTCAWGRSTAPC